LLRIGVFFLVCYATEMTSSETAISATATYVENYLECE